MVRLHIVAEGQTEETYVNTELSVHLANFNVFADVRCVQTSRRRGKWYRGGLIDYSRAKPDLVLWMKEDQNVDSHFSTMFDLYALPDDFPGQAAGRSIVDPYRRVSHLEQHLQDDLKHPSIRTVCSVTRVRSPGALGSREVG